MWGPKKAAKKKEPASVHQLKVVLSGSKPQIWRRLLVDSETPLDVLHYILQDAMGWTNSHLHLFDAQGVQYGEKNPEWEARDERPVRLNQIAASPKAKFKYEYDMGDGWRHEITVEKILPAEPGKKYPVCLEGALACPPEDCGGIGGYYNLLETVRDPKREDHEEMREWLGDDFDPNAFDLNAINKLLKKL